MVSMYIDYLSLQKTGKWNAMHVRIAWEIYNHQHKNTDPSKSQPSSLNPSSSAIRDSNSRILSNELTKKPNLESDKSKFAPPVISRTGDRLNFISGQLRCWRHLSTDKMSASFSASDLTEFLFGKKLKNFFEQKTLKCRHCLHPLRRWKIEFICIRKIFGALSNSLE